MGVFSSSVSVWVFTDPAGVEAAEELAKATGVCVTVLDRPVGVCEQRAVEGLQDSTDMKVLEEQGGKTAAGWTEDFIPVDCLFLRRAAAPAGRCSSHNSLDWVSFSLHRCTVCVQFDMRIKSRIVPVVSH